jgi:urea transport system permease protein
LCSLDFLMKQLLVLVGLAWIWVATPIMAQDTPLQDVLQAHQKEVERASRKTIDTVLDALARQAPLGMTEFLEAWAAKDVWMRKEDKMFFYATTEDKKRYSLIDLDSGAVVAEVGKRDVKQLKPNSGVRGVIAGYLVQFQLQDNDISRRLAAVIAIERNPDASHYDPLQASIATETDLNLLERKKRLERLLTVRFATNETARIAAIRGLAGDLGLDARAALNPILATRWRVASEVPQGANLARTVLPDTLEWDVDIADRLLVQAGILAPAVTLQDVRRTLEANVIAGRVGGVPVAQLHTQDARRRAYDALVNAGKAPVYRLPLGLWDWSDVEDLQTYALAAVYDEVSPAVTTAAAETLATINRTVGINQALDLGLDALSLASIYFLAAIGLAITFGVMGVINMAHGEFIMMGAYTGYVVQLYIADHTLSLIVAVPMAFAVTFAAGVAMERLVIRWLYDRPLETLLATFGISIALQQLAKNIFGTQARPLTAPGWLDGAWVINDVVSISYIRVAIFALALLFLGLFLYIMRSTRLGLETRAVTQNRRMAASMGINPDRVNMLTFGLGSGIAGIAGVAIGLFAKVTSELGNDYIVQSFMTVVVGGVGNIWGTLAGATMIGVLQKGIEWMTPSNTLAAQTFMIVFIIVFIQFRPRGIIALKGRAAGD